MNHTHKSFPSVASAEITKRTSQGVRQILRLLALGLLTTICLANAQRTSSVNASTAVMTQGSCADAYSIGQAISRHQGTLDTIARATPTRFAPLRIPVIYTRYRKA